MDTTPSDVVQDLDHLASRLTSDRRRVTKPKTIRNWVRTHGFPMPPSFPAPYGPIREWLEGPHSPKPKREDTPRGGDDESALRIKLLEEQIRHLRGKNEVLEGTRLDANVVLSAISAGNADLKRELLSDLLVKLWAICQDKPADTAVPEMRAVVEGAFERHLDRCKRGLAGADLDEDDTDDEPPKSAR